MNTSAIDFYAPYEMPDGRMIYGAAAANKRYADAGGFNKVAHDLVAMGVRLGFEKALQDMHRPIRF